jgi:CheY-like chemotaxis protein
MDMQMAVMNGLDSTETIRDAGKVDLLIVALTTNAFESDKEACFVAGINDFIYNQSRQKK